jgi:peptide deformylase
MIDELIINTGDALVEKKIEPLPLYGENHPLLLEKMPNYTDDLPNPIMTNLIDRMKLTIKKYQGIGLSANQCGVSARVFILSHGDFFLACINPKVIEASAEVVRDNEGCLSFPGLYCKILRPKSIQVEFTTPEGEVVQTKLEGITARCFLHELDHLNGVRFVDYLGPVALKMARKKQDKIFKIIKKTKK